jgi:hypothetical protein
MPKAAVLAVVLALSFISCSGEPYGTVAHRARDGRPDQWIYRIDNESYKVSLDTNGDGRPDVVKTFKHGQLVKVEEDRDFNGQTDLVAEYSGGVLVRKIHDDDFDGKPEKIETFRADGTLAMVEHDSHESGLVDSVEHYDDSGKLVRRHVRSK